MCASTLGSRVSVRSVGRSPTSWASPRLSTAAVALPRLCHRASRWPGQDPAVLEKRAARTGGERPHPNTKPNGGEENLQALLDSAIFVLDSKEGVSFHRGKLRL